MNKYYIEENPQFNKFNIRDLIIISLLVIFICGIVLIHLHIKNLSSIKMIQPYCLERFYSIPSKKDRFSDTNYDVAISFLPLHDSIRDLKFKLKDLNKSINSLQKNYVKNKAMDDIIKMLYRIKAGESIDLSKMQQAVLEAGFGNIDLHLLDTAVKEYQAEVAQNRVLQNRLIQEKEKFDKKLKKDAKETGIFASDIAKEIAEEEIEGFIQNLSIIARIGNFIIKKVNNE